MKIDKLFVTLAVGVLSVAPVFADPVPAPAAPAPAAPRADIWSGVPEVVAVVDGKNVSRDELVKFMFPDGKIPPQATAEVIAKVAPGAVRRMLINRLAEADFAARRPKVTKEDARKFLMADFERLSPAEKQMVLQALKEKGKTVEQAIDELASNPETLDNIAQETFAKTVIFKNCDVTDEEARKMYDAHLAELPEIVGASHILVQVKPGASEAEIKAALDRINRIAEELKKDPAAFGTIAARESDCPSKAQGGKLGEFPRGRMVPEFEKAVFSLKPGEISGVVRTQFGYHIIRCDSAPRRLPFEMMKARIKQQLTREKMQRAFEAYVDGLMKQHGARILIAEPAPAPAPAAPAAPAAR